jgi:hypothetical protein
VRIDTALTYESEFVESIEKRSADLGPLSYQNQSFGIPQSLGEFIDVLDVIVPDLYFVIRQFCEAIECADRVMIIVKD